MRSGNNQDSARKAVSVPLASGAPPTVAVPTGADTLAQLLKHPPFSTMHADDVLALVQAATEVHFSAGAAVISPDTGVVSAVYIVLEGEISAHDGIAELSSTGFQYEAGDMFPVEDALASRPITSTYAATTAARCLQVPLKTMDEVARRSPALAGFFAGKTMRLLELSRQATQTAYAAQALSQLSLERKLRDLPRKQPVTCLPSSTVGEVLNAMQEKRVGSVIVTDTAGTIEGIFTRKDVLTRVALPQTALSAPVARVMTREVRSLDADDTVEDAILLTSRHGIRHVPILEDGQVIGVVSERDLFAIHRLSLKQVSSSARAANDVPGLQFVAQSIRTFARSLLSQGVHAKSLTGLISHLNDVLTTRLLEIVAGQRGLSLDDMCWLSFGSEGRSEQTISTDQDNGLIFISDDPDRDRPKWLAFGHEVTLALDACGFPLCKGNIMASNPDCCMTLDEWKKRFSFWVEQGTPENLLKANIFFDFRALSGKVALAQTLRDFVTALSRAFPLFQKLLADDILRRSPPLNWYGAIDTERIGKQDTVDLKLRGTAIFVDVARLQSLALGIPETSTRRRFEAIARASGIEPQRGEAWVAAFEFLQMLRLRVQLDGEDSPGWVPGHPNKVELAALNDIDRKLLKESFRIARRLQQRIELDYYS